MLPDPVRTRFRHFRIDGKCVATLAAASPPSDAGVVCVGFAICHAGKDRFDKARGRQIAEGRMQKAMTSRVGYEPLWTWSGERSCFIDWFRRAKGAPDRKTLLVILHNWIRSADGSI